MVNIGNAAAFGYFGIAHANLEHAFTAKFMAKFFTHQTVIRRVIGCRQHGVVFVKFQCKFRFLGQNFAVINRNIGQSCLAQCAPIAVNHHHGDIASL